MFSVGNLSGILMCIDTPILDFAFDRGDLVRGELLCTDKAKLPIEFWDLEINTYSVTKFFEERITPPTRQFLKEDLERAGIPYYDPELILRYNNGLNIADAYWVRFSDGPQTRKALLTKQGFVVNGKCAVV